MKNLKLILSYVLVAMLASFTTMAAFGGVPEEEYSKLDDLADLIEAYFIEDTDRTAMEDAAARAMVDSLGDRWSYYMSASDYLAYTEQMQNAYVGVGITVTAREDGTGIDIIQVVSGGPAEEAGLQVGDELCSGDVDYLVTPTCYENNSTDDE